MADNPLRLGHAAWVWIDIRGIGKRWELAVPGLDEFDEEVRMPLAGWECDLREVDDCPMRKISTPESGPTEAEIAAASACEAAHAGDDEDTAT